MKRKLSKITLPLVLLCATPLIAQDGPSATANVANADGESVGTVELMSTASGVALVRVDLSNMPEGVHGIHIHETGDCSAADFESAGGHLAGDKEHGVMAENGPHPGDMPNATVGSDGFLKVDAFVAGLDIDSMVFDDDGSGFIVHSGADDYASQPSGEAGSRIACGVFEQS